MASDLLAKISGEVQQRMRELRPLVSEYERLLVASRSLTGMADAPDAATPAAKTAPARRTPRPRVTAARTPKAPPAKRRVKRQPPPLSAVGQAVLDALEHGSHTVSELVMVTAMSASEIRGNVRRLLAESRVAKVDRDGKTAYTLPDKKQ